MMARVAGCPYYLFTPPPSAAGGSAQPVAFPAPEGAGL